MERITEDQAAAIAANAPSRQVRRALQRKVDKHNARADQAEKVMRQVYRNEALRELKRSGGALATALGL